MPKNIRKNWMDTLSLMAQKPIVMLPFIIMAFLEALALELIYFFPRRPLAYFVKPIVKKFIGEGFVHYPGNLLILPSLFYYAHTLIYIFCGALLAGISVDVFKNLKLGVALEKNVLIKEAGRRYLSFAGYAIIVVCFGILMQEAESSVLSKFPSIAQILIFFLSNVMMYTFFILTIPIIVIKRKSLLPALLESIALGWRNFFRIFALIFLPFLIYLPIAVLKNFPFQLTDKTFPEMNLYVAALGIVVAMFLNCFLVICAAKFLLNREPGLLKKGSGAFKG